MPVLFARGGCRGAIEDVTAPERSRGAHRTPSIYHSVLSLRVPVPPRQLLEALLGAEAAYSAIARAHPSPPVATLPSERLAREPAPLAVLARFVDYAPSSALALAAVRVLALLGAKVISRIAHAGSARGRLGLPE